MDVRRWNRAIHDRTLTSYKPLVHDARSARLGSPMPTDDVIDLAELRQELIRPGGLWQKVDLVAETGSTNADLAARARQGEAPGTVLITDYQSAGRGGRAAPGPRHPDRA